MKTNENDERDFLNMMRSRLTSGYGLSNGEALMLLDSAEKAAKGQTPERRLDAMDERLNKAASVVDSVARFMHKLEKKVEALEARSPADPKDLAIADLQRRLSDAEVSNRNLRKRLFFKRYV